jgi:NAD(P)-dependent dehydrogenase (short-subunit alcohol dehydrogenase family)
VLTQSLRGTGYIGSFTALSLLEDGYKVVVVDSLYNSSKVSLDRIELLCGKRPIFYEVDVTNEEALDKVFQEHPDIDSVIHFAALKVGLRGHLLEVLNANNSRLSESPEKNHSNTIASMWVAQLPSYA